MPRRNVGSSVVIRTGVEGLVVASREYLISDQVVARRNDRRLRNDTCGEFVKNGSAGTVTKLHPKTGEVSVAFAREGTIRVQRTYLAAGRLEHGYARTSYGVQGATHGTARYHPTAQSSFEEGDLTVASERQQHRVEWFDEYADVVDRYDLSDAPKANDSSPKRSPEKWPHRWG